MVVLNAKNLTRGDVQRLLGLEPRLDGSFTPLLALESLSDEEQRELFKGRTGSGALVDFGRREQK